MRSAALPPLSDFAVPIPPFSASHMDLPLSLVTLRQVRYRPVFIFIFWKHLSWLKDGLRLCLSFLARLSKSLVRWVFVAKEWWHWPMYLLCYNYFIFGGAQPKFELFSSDVANFFSLIDGSDHSTQSEHFRYGFAAREEHFDGEAINIIRQCFFSSQVNHLNHHLCFSLHQRCYKYIIKNHVSELLNCDKNSFDIQSSLRVSRLPILIKSSWIRICEKFLIYFPFKKPIKRPVLIIFPILSRVAVTNSGS